MKINSFNFLTALTYLLLLCFNNEYDAQQKFLQRSSTLKNNIMMTTENEIKIFFDRYVDYWNNHDMEMWGSLFTEDTDFITWSGTWYKSKNDNQKNHQKAHQILQEQQQNMTYELRDIKIKMLSPYIAIVHATWVWPNFKTNQRTENRSGRLTMVLVKTIDNWLIKATQNTRTDKIVE